MKKIVAVALFVFLVAVSSILIAGFLGNRTNNNQAGNIGSQKTAVNKTISKTAGLTLNLAEIAKHNSASDCWLLISGKVYDVTNAIGSHPGGPGTIINTCGTDATVAFSTKGRPSGNSHSPAAESMLTDYYIGDFNQKTGQ